MKKIDESKILVTGGNGMVGFSLKQIIPNAIFISSQDYDLRNRGDALEVFYKYKPEYCIHLAARVGGIKANMDNLGSFFLDNTRINTNVLEAAKEYVKSYNITKKFKLVSTLSTCVYPDEVTYPLTEEQIHRGEPHPSNFGYAFSKRMLDVQSRAYRKQYGCNFVTVVFNNLIGENDNYDLESSHVVPALIRKIYEAKINKKKFVVLWGNGENLREFSYSLDMAKALIFILNNYDGEYPINVGNIKEYSISDIANHIADTMEYEGKILYDTDELSGQYKKPSSNEKFLKLGWDEKNYTDTKQVIKKIVEYFVSNYPNLRGVKK